MNSHPNLTDQQQESNPMDWLSSPTPQPETQAHPSLIIQTEPQQPQHQSQSQPQQKLGSQTGPISNNAHGEHQRHSQHHQQHLSAEVIQDLTHLYEEMQRLNIPLDVHNFLKHACDVFGYDRQSSNKGSDSANSVNKKESEEQDIMKNCFGLSFVYDVFFKNDKKKGNSNYFLNFENSNKNSARWDAFEDGVLSLTGLDNVASRILQPKDFDRV
ncbi:unnamed protein product [Ambrosiozyma monospora]|uniref:Unnamed protein product n=1 Tax=Ambrosiozyma monospora TaxID=43982 RepID=A0ACB5TBC4_AMBMO|nr:unnamed protein product [Ambrosiozyma monospora]